MRETLLGKLLMVLSRATPEELEAIHRFATGEGLSGEMLDDRARRGAAGGAAQGRVQSKPAYVFRWTGRDWEVVFGGGRAFHLPNVLGALRKHLRQGGPEERAFEERLRSQLSIGHECMYSAPEGRVWE